MTRNRAQIHGGAIFFSISTQLISITSSVFSENVALTGSGGAVYFEKMCTKTSIGGLTPMALGDNSVDSFTLPEASGYYVTFDETTNLDGDTYLAGIEISDSVGPVYLGRRYYQDSSIPRVSPSPVDNLATWPGVDGNAPLYVSGHTLSYEMHREGNVFYFTAYPILNNQSPNKFTGNIASLSGGAIHWGKANADIFVMPGTMFKNNSVTTKGGSGGAIFMENGNRIIYMYSSKFIDNRAYKGGALALSQSNYPMSMFECSFMHHHASGYGGAVYLGDGNGYGFFKILTSSAIKFISSVFSSNTASLGGGGIRFKQQCCGVQ
jgi:predicted outer membrane repeat protein